MSKKKSTAPTELAEAEASAPSVVLEAAPAEMVARLLGQWNRLVSTTNWEKGRIICEWRDALVAAGEPVTAYSDEAWAQLVGGVTSQHVGRLRRVFQSFGDKHDQFEGLYWSHFQAALDWEDAEMWLEGAIRNRWSVSQMRGQRWETLGLTGEPEGEAGGEAELDAEAAAEAAQFHESFEGGEAKRQASAATTEGETDDEDAEESATGGEESAPWEDSRAAAPAREKAPRGPAVDPDELPTDMADAFEQFKLAIIAQRRLGWSETTPEAVLECLDALRALTLAPGEG